MGTRSPLRSGHPTRTEEWHAPEPTADDDPEIARRPVAPKRVPDSIETVRLELARFLSRTAFPAPLDLADTLRDRHAPDPLVEAVERRPHEARCATVHEPAESVVRARHTR
ncbi:hypothetical protein [Streptomyces sp. NPDC097610]|uniref:DUF2795 domain-containing protein n=1 Tax=Streptomyces sp. NPDC097610 TaxID=3157227 RepID=UPI00332E72A0